MATSTATVFLTPELIEAILLQLPMRDLLVHAPLVSKTFQTIISSSPSIQKALYFVPSESGNPSSCKRTSNPLLQAAFPPWFANDENTKWPRRNFEDFLSLDWNSSAQKTEAYARRQASWRRMLPMQPPINELRVLTWKHFRGGNAKEKGVVDFADGVRMGMLWDCVEAYLIAHSPVSSFCLQWYGWPECDEAPYVTVHLRYVVQCNTSSYGKGFGVRKGNPGVEWVFRSHGYEDMPITFESIPR